MISVGIMVAIIILASAIHKYVVRCCKVGISGQTEQRLMARMDELDRRLTDIQDVMIAVDEKLNRTEVMI